MTERSPGAPGAGLPNSGARPPAARRLARLLLLRGLARLAGPLARRPAGHPRAILYLKPDHLGDLLLATPALAALRWHLPRARISALVGPWGRAALARNPDIDRLLTYPFPGFERAADRPTQNPEPRAPDVEPRLWERLQRAARPWWELLRYGMLLRACGYDLAIIGRDDHWWGAALTLLAGIPQRVGFDVPECRPFLTTALPWHPDDHVTDQGLALVAAVPDGQPTAAADGATDPTQTAHQPAGDRQAWAARFDPEPQDLAWAEAWIAQELGGAGKLVIIHPGTGGPAKLWLSERWTALAEALAARGDVRLLLTGGPGEEALAAAVASGMHRPAPSLAGQTSLGQLAALLRRADLVLGVDSGPLHLAAAQGTPTIHLYGPGDERRFGPWGDPARHTVLRSPLWCSPCGVFGACPRGLATPECMQRISTPSVLAAVQRALDTQP